MRLVTVATFDNTSEAHVAKTELESAGIKAVVTDETVVSQLWHVGALNGMKLQVAEENEEDARRVLFGEREDADDEMRIEWRCLHCREVIEAGFAVCWSCGASREEAADPDFVPPAGEPQAADDREEFAENEPQAEALDALFDPGNPYAAGRAHAAPADVEEVAAASEEIEERVIRAWRAAVIGIGLLPIALHAYSLFLLVSVGIAGVQLSAAGKWRFVAALVIDLLVLAAAATFLVWALTGG